MNLSNITDRLSFFKALYEENRNRQSALYEKMERFYEQYKGSKAIDGSHEDACAVRNITYELIESQVSTQIPSPAAEARYYTEQNDRNAKSVERLCSSLRRDLPFEYLNDIDERYTYIYGGSVWFAEWDDSTEKNGRHGEVRLYCLPPSDFVPESGIYNVCDMEYCFLRFLTTKNDIARRYGIPTDELENEGGAEGGADDTLELILCFWRDDSGKIAKFAYAGDVVLCDVEDYYARKSEYCVRCGKKKLLCACKHPKIALRSEESEVLREDLYLQDGRRIPARLPDKNGTMSKPNRLPFFRPSRFPVVIRKNTSEERSLFGQSDCEFIRPEQQEINKIESRILQKLMRAGITPILPDDAEMTLDNSIFGQVIRLRAGDEKERYGVLDTTPAIRQDIEQSDRLYDHAKRIIGITDTYLGMSDNTAISGYAKKVQVEQAAGRLESKRRMKQVAYAELDRILFEYHLAYADEPRPLSYRDAFGTKCGCYFSRYDFLSYNEESEAYEYDSDFIFSVDLGGGVEQQRELLWEKNLQNLQAGTLGNVADPATLLHYWQCQERAHYPYARENVEYFRALAEKGGSHDQNEAREDRGLPQEYVPPLL